jgi:hypothetical protein
MKISRIVFVCLCSAAAPQLAMAEMPSPQALGIVQAILTYCAQVDPKEAALYQAQWKLVVGHASQQQLNSIEGSTGYKQGYDLISGQLSKTSKEDSAKACAAGVSSHREKEDAPRRPSNGQQIRPRK